MRNAAVWYLAAAMLLSTASGAAHDINPNAPGVGVEEKLGATVPLDTRFVAEDGTAVTLGALINKPTILTLQYYRCKNACGLLLSGTATLLGDIAAVPGRDFSVVTVSINDRETPEDAREEKQLALEQVPKPYPPEAWRFLTGSDDSIDALADAVGYRFVQTAPDDFDHPLGLIVLSPQGKIVRYIGGTDFLPADVKLSLLEASSGTIQPTVAKLLRFCFSVDPQSHQMVFNTLRVSAVVIFLVLGGFVLYLVLSGRKRRVQGGRN